MFEYLNDLIFLDLYDLVSKCLIFNLFIAVRTDKMTRSKPAPRQKRRPVQAVEATNVNINVC